MSVQRRPRTGKPASGKVRWLVRARDAAGKEINGGTYYTEKEAKAADAALRESLRRGTWIDPALQKVTVRQLVQDYVDLATKPGTKRDREILLANLGDLESMPIGAVRRSHVQQWALQLRDGRPWAGGEPFSPGTVQVKTGQMRTVLRRAEDDGLVVKSPGEVLRRFDAGKPKDFVLPTDEDVKALYKHATKPWFGHALRLGAEAGLRAGEVGGLRVQDVDFLRCVLHVRVQSPPGKRGGVVPLKSEHSRRDVPISRELAERLSTCLDGRRCGPDDRVLLSELGYPLFSSRMSHLMSDTRLAAGVDEQIHFHSLRHFWITRLLAEGVPLPTVSMLAGHSNVAVTARIYAHHLPGQEDVARDALVRLAGKLRANPTEGDESEDVG